MQDREKIRGRAWAYQREAMGVKLEWSLWCRKRDIDGNDEMEKAECVLTGLISSAVVKTIREGRQCSFRRSPCYRKDKQ